MVDVIRPELAAGLDLGQARPDEFAADVMADERLLDTPAVAVSCLMPLVAVQVEALHRANVAQSAPPVATEDRR
jgi:hypothetical protein